MTLLPWECPSPGWHIFGGTRKGQISSLEVFGEDQGSLHQLSLLFVSTVPGEAAGRAALPTLPGRLFPPEMAPR